MLALIAVFAVICALSPWSPAKAAKKLSFVSDAEIENTIRVYATPLFQAAGLDPSSVRIHLVGDKSLNAFVAGGQNLFLNTGLLMRTEHAGQVIGVIAHEIGHIAGGHLSRIHDAMRDTTAQSILAYVLGGAAAIGTGRPELGQAIILGGQQAALRTFLRYTRTQESAADQAAFRLLEATNTSAQGLLEFFEILGDQELLSVRHQDPYVRTHPLTFDRVEALRNHLSRSTSARALPADYSERHRRMRAKLMAFLNPISRTLREYKATDTAIEARYARAIAYCGCGPGQRRAELDKALALIEGLIRERPADPFFQELRGQMLFENGRVAESLDPFGRAVQLQPGSYLLRIGLARAQLENNDPALLASAILNLRAALLNQPNSASIWHQLAIAYGRDGQMGMSALSMAEEAFLKGKKRDARYHAKRAEKVLPRGSPAWLQAQDIQAAAEEKKE